MQGGKPVSRSRWGAVSFPDFAMLVHRVGILCSFA